MRKFFIKMGDWISEILRRYCGALSPGQRLVAILAICLVFAVLNFYMIFSAIYDMGKSDAKRELIEIEHIKSLELEKVEKTAPDSNSYKQSKINDNESENE